MWLVIQLGNIAGGSGAARYCDDVGRAIFDEIRLELGAVKFDVLTSEHEHAYDELTRIKERQYGRRTGKSESELELVEWAKNTQTLYIPLNFWCFRRPM